MITRSLRNIAGRIVIALRALAIAMCGVLAVPVGQAATAPTEASAPAGDGSMDVMGEFNKDQAVKSEIVSISDQRKRLIMFLMGVPLLTFILITAGLGVAMGVYGKPVYLPHMIFAGLSVTLAIAHAVVGIVWFYPF